MSLPILHYWPEATSLAPHILLNATGKPYTTIKATVTSENVLDEEFRRLNPKGLVPVLIVNANTVITESTAVMTAIAQLAPEEQLLGRTDLETVGVYEWMNWLSGTVHSQIWVAILRPERFSDATNAHNSIREKGLMAVANAYGMIESKLSGSYAIGDYFTIVDPFLYVLWRWGAARSLVNPETHPNYARLVSRLEDMECVINAVQSEGSQLLVSIK